MLSNFKLQDILFIDIETVSEMNDLAKLSVSKRILWKEKAERIAKHKKQELSIKESYFTNAGIYAEFGKIVCISCGHFSKEDQNQVFKLKSFYGDNEGLLLKDFFDHLGTKRGISFCGHNIKEFDVPYIARRAIINKVKLPKPFLISGKKPWEINHLIDTLQLWRFGDYKNYTSLDLLANVLGIESPKTEMDGSKVNNYYWIKNDLKRIVKYCENDVITTSRILAKLAPFKFPSQFKIKSS